MRDLRNEFVTYEIALALKELGFDEECFGYYNPDEELIYGIDFKTIKCAHKYHKEDESVLSPIWGQVIDWFDTLGYKISIQIDERSNFQNIFYQIYKQNEPIDTPECIFSWDWNFESRRECIEQAILKAIELINENLVK